MSKPLWILNSIPALPSTSGHLNACRQSSDLPLVSFPASFAKHSLHSSSKKYLAGASERCKQLTRLLGRSDAVSCLQTSFSASCTQGGRPEKAFLGGFWEVDSHSIEEGMHYQSKKGMHLWLWRGGNKHVLQHRERTDLGFTAEPRSQKPKSTNVFLGEGFPAALPPSPCRVSSLLSLAVDCSCYSILPELSSKLGCGITLFPRTMMSYDFRKKLAFILAINIPWTSHLLVGPFDCPFRGCFPPKMSNIHTAFPSLL